MKRIHSIFRILGPLAAVVLCLAPGRAGLADDTILFSTAAVPNVMLIVDNSLSMQNIVWHPAFDPNDASSWGCNAFTTGFSGTWGWESISSNTSRTYCGRTRTLYADPSTSQTWWDHRYLNWYFGLDASNPSDAAILSEIAATANGTYSACLGGGTYSKYRRSRVTAAQQVLREVICQVNNSGKVRFGMAQFRNESDPEGGFVVVPIDDYTAAQDAALASAINNLSPETYTPLGETLFQIYTYFMSRNTADIPYGGPSSTTKFPAYSYSTSTSGEGGAPTLTPPPDPVQYRCQKNFVVIITDGEPTRDDFDNDSSPGVDLGFTDFKNGDLIGDYNADGEVENQPDVVCSGCETALWLDDIAKFMHERDFRPDLADGVDSSGNPIPQTIDVYTVGFTTPAFADALLQKTANVGGGQFYKSNSAEALAVDLVSAISDIIQKSQAFTAATVPATRTADGGNFYASYFIPSGTNPFWEGHIRNFSINAAGEILDAQSPAQCALDDPTPGQCLSGQILPSAVPYWDAADEMPAPASRNLYTSYNDTTQTPTAGNPNRDYVRRVLTIPFADDAGQMGVTYPPAVTYPNSSATTAEQLADEIVQYARGCEPGSGVAWSALDTNCIERTRPDGNPRTLGDIFHSDPVIVGHPNSSIKEASYGTFAQTYATRERVLFAGANDGFLHGFAAGSYDGSTLNYDRGTGEEKFGFMPWTARQNIRQLPVDTGNRDYYFVDGSPQAADAWFYPTATSSTKAADGSEWHTVLIGSMRQGGDQYFALDITDPTSGSYPQYLWEFPRENDTTGFSSSSTWSYHDYMGESWSDAVITKVKVTVAGDPTMASYERWVAIFGGGYDPTGDPNNAAYDATNTAATSRKGRAIFMVDVKTGRVLAAHFFHHDALDANLGTAGGGSTEMRYAIASTPAVIDEDFDGFADVVYVGDLGGNIWKWVIKDAGVDTVNGLNADGTDRTPNKAQSNWTFGKLFSAPVATYSGTDYYKSFFFPPAVTYYNGNLWLAIGSGERANPSFAGVSGVTGDNNRFYAFRDPNKLGLPDLNGDTIPDVITESDLTDLTTVEGCASFANLGYYLVADEGEKFVTNTEIIAYYVFAGSFIPSTSGDPCDSGGTSNLYLFKVYCGEGYFPTNTGADQRRTSLGNGMPTSPRLSLGEENRVYMMTSENELKTPPTPPLPIPGEGILYWRELQ